MSKLLPYVAALFAAAILAIFAAAGASFAHEVDLKRLPVGDGMVSKSAKKSFIWACHTDPNAGGAQRQGPWFNGDGTYDLTAKIAVPGDVMWDPKFAIAKKGDKRTFSTNDLPSHGTGVFPVGSKTQAYKYDRNPNSIKKQKMEFNLPADPALAAKPNCAPGAVGIMLSGSVLFNALDAPGRDAVAWETQDKCQGHPQESGVYHYHSVSPCVDTKTLPDGHSILVGYAIDGFGIFGHKGEGGQALSSGDLDACHGHTHAIEWDGKTVTMYHYHATWDFPYTIGCLRGSYDQSIVSLISGPRPSGGGKRAKRPNPPPKRQGPPPRRKLP